MFHDDETAVLSQLRGISSMCIRCQPEIVNYRGSNVL